MLFQPPAFPTCGYFSCAASHTNIPHSTPGQHTRERERESAITSRLHSGKVHIRLKRAGDGKARRDDGPATPPGRGAAAAHTCSRPRVTTPLAVNSTVASFEIILLLWRSWRGGGLTEWIIFADVLPFMLSCLALVSFIFVSLYFCSLSNGCAYVLHTFIIVLSIMSVLLCLCLLIGKNTVSLSPTFLPIFLFVLLCHCHCHPEDIPFCHNVYLF